MTNPESSVISDIDALIDEQLSGGPQDDFNVNRYDKCPNCHADWHGLPNYGCPGSLETVERPAAGPGASNGVLARLWDADVATWDWSVEIGESNPLAALQRVVQNIWEMFASVIGLPEDVFDASSWFDADALREIQQRIDDGTIVEMARDTAMPPVLVPDGFVRLALEESQGQ